MTSRRGRLAGLVLVVLGGVGAGALLGEGGTPPAAGRRLASARAACPAETCAGPVLAAPTAMASAAASREPAPGEPAPGEPAPGEPAPRKPAPRESAARPLPGDGEEEGAEAAERARAGELLAELAGEEDPLAAEILGEELATLAPRLNAAGQARLAELAREANAPRLAALRALGRLEPDALAVERVTAAAATRTSGEVRAAAVDALLLLQARGAPAGSVEAALLQLRHPGWR
jgi:hypothetical protein